MKKAESILRDALADTGAVIPLHSVGRGGYIEFLCKQMPGHESRWLFMVESLLRWAETKGIQSNFLIARRYLLKDNRMVFGWFLSIDLSSAAKLQDACETLARCLETATREAETLPVAAVKQVQSPQTPNASKRSEPSPLIRIVKQGVDEQGRVYEESVMALPHARSDLNVPSKPKWNEELGRFVGGNRGAKYTGVGG